MLVQIRPFQRGTAVAAGVARPADCRGRAASGVAFHGKSLVRVQFHLFRPEIDMPAEIAPAAHGLQAVHHLFLQHLQHLQHQVRAIGTTMTMALTKTLSVQVVATSIGALCSQPVHTLVTW